MIASKLRMVIVLFRLIRLTEPFVKMQSRCNSRGASSPLLTAQITWKPRSLISDRSKDTGQPACNSYLVGYVRTLCYATMLPGRKSGFQAGFRPEARFPAGGKIA